MFQQKRLTIAMTGMTLFTADFPNSIVLEDDDVKEGTPNRLHIYELDETETANTVVVAFGLDYRFSHIADENEAKALIKQKKRGTELKEEGEEDEGPDFSDVLIQAEAINSSGSSLEN